MTLIDLSHNRVTSNAATYHSSLTAMNTEERSLASASPPKFPDVPTLRQASLATLFSRSVTVVSGLVSSALLPLVLNQAIVGQFFFAQILIAGFGTISQLGLTLSIPAMVSEAVAKNELGRARQISIVGLLLCAGAGISSATGVMALSYVSGYGGLTDSNGSLTASAVIALAIPVVSLYTVLIEILRSLHAIRGSANLAAAGNILTVGYLTFALFTSAQASLTKVLFAGLAGWTGCLIIGLWILARIVSKWPTRAFSFSAAVSIVRFTAPNLITTTLLFLLANVDILLLTAFGTMNEVAQYGIALRISALIVMSLGILNSSVAPLAVHARAKDETQSLKAMLNTVAKTGAGIAIFLYLGLIVGAPIFIFNWYPAYENSYWLALILGFGNVCHACGGSAGMLLMTWGDQGAAFRITAIVGVLTVIACWVGLAIGGVFGLATASAVGNALQVAVFVYRVRGRFGLDPSILDVFKRKSSTR